MNTAVPQRKVVVGALAGALVLVAVWAAKAFKGVEVPAEVGMALTTALTFVLQYLVPNADAGEDAGPSPQCSPVAFVAALVMALALIGCGTAPPTPNAVLVGLHKTLAAYDENVGLAAFAGRLSPDKADALLDRSDKLRGQLVDARALLKACGGKLPCKAYDDVLRSINEQLIEAECRRREQEAGRTGDTCKLPPKT